MQDIKLEDMIPAAHQVKRFPLSPYRAECCSLSHHPTFSYRSHANKVRKQLQPQGLKVLDST